VEGDSSTEEFSIPYEPTTTITDVIHFICKKRKLNPEIWSFSTDKATNGNANSLKLRDLEEKEMTVFVKRRRAKKKRIYVLDSFTALPDEFQKRILKSGISEKQAQKYINIVLNILHFKTKHNFFTTDQFEDRHSIKVKRRNKGPSLVDSSIVSVNPFEEEAEELLSNNLKKKDFKTICQIGKGGFGRVFVMKSYVDGNATVAIKKVPHTNPKQMRKNFQEIRFLKYCHHPNIVEYIRSYLVKDEVWLVLEYMQGGTLSQAVKAHDFEEPEIAYIAKNVLAGVSFLHKNFLAHRDLKSGNIMLDFTGGVKLIDFGLCSDVSQGEVVHMVGSPFWMPPEMIKREPHGIAADIWSFAICIIELANGHPPCRISSIQAMFMAGTTGFPNPIEDRDGKPWSKQFRDFLSHCLEVNPAERWTAKQLLEHPWLKKTVSKEEIQQLFKTIFLANRLSYNF